MAQATSRSRTTLAAFAGPSLPLAALGLPLVVYLPNHYTATLGLDIGMVGWAFLLVRLIDIAFDPLFGAVLDRTHWRIGRFKPWLAIGAPLVLVAVYMLFMAEPGVGPAYLWFWLITAYIGYSICVLSHIAWGSTLSTDYNQRSRVYAFWQTGNVVGMILVLLLPVLLNHVPALTGRMCGVQAMGWFIIVTLPVMLALALRFVPEPRIARADHGAQAGLGDYFALFARPAVLRILVADLLLGLAPAVAGSLFFFYFEQAKGFPKGTAEALLLVYFVAAIVGAPIWVKLSQRFGKHVVLIASSVVYAVAQFAVVVLPQHDFWLAAPFLIFAGLPYSAAPFLLRAMLADVGDEERLRTGVDRTGLLYAILTGTVKVSQALAVASFIVLGAMGFDSHNPAATTQTGLLGLQVLYAAAPGLLGLLAAWVMVGYPLTEARHAEIRARLAERDAAPPSQKPVPPPVADALNAPAE